MSSQMLVAQIKVTFDGDGDETTPSGTITVNLGDNTATLSDLTGTMGIGAPSVSGGLGGVSGSFDIRFEALGTIAQNFNPDDFTGGEADGVFTTATEWAGNSDISNNANNSPGQGIVFTFDFTNLVGGDGIDFTAVRWHSNRSNSRLNFMAQGDGTSIPLSPSENATAPPDSSDQTVEMIVPQPLRTGDQLAFWSGGSHQKRLKEFTFNFVPDGITTPVNLAGTTDGGKVDLTWSVDQSGTLASYSVFRSETQGGPYGPAIATGVPSSSYSDTTVVTGTTYFYAVSATDTGATETGLSDEFEITPVIQAPTNLTVVPGDSMVALDWDDNLSTVFASYSVYRSEFAEGPYDTPIASGLITSEYADTSAINETPYFYVVTATDNTVDAGESVNSSVVSATPFAPVIGSSLYAHLDASVEDSVGLDDLGEVPEKVLTWADLTDNFNDGSEGPGTVLYPSGTVSTNDLPGLDMGSDRNVLNFQNGAAQDEWLDFSTTGPALRYSGFAVFAAVTADTILAGTNRDVVMSSVESRFRLAYEAGRPQILLGGVKLENPAVVDAGETVVIGVNYEVATGNLEIWDSLSNSISSTTVPAADFTEARELYLGGAVNDGQYMDGMIGEVKVYRGAMTPTEFENEGLAMAFKWAGTVGLTATLSDGVVDLDWGDLDADAYNVYRNFELLAENVPVSEYRDTDIVNGEEYEYFITAIKDGEEGPDSELITVIGFTSIEGNELYSHYDASVESSVILTNGNEVSEWEDQSVNSFFVVPDTGTFLYPSGSLSPTNLPGIDTTGDRVKNTLLAFTAAEQSAWLDFTSTTGAQAYSGFSVFAVVKADAILGGALRDIVIANNGNPAVEGGLVLRYQDGIPELILDSQSASRGNSVVEAGETIVLAANYEAATGNLQFWDSENASSVTITVPVGDFTGSENRSLFFAGSNNGEQRMEGMIGEVKIYRGAMTASEFAEEREALSLKWLGSIPVSGFSTWITGTFANGTVPDDEQDPDDDFDKDGISNLVEYGIDGEDPTVPNPTVGSISGDTLSFTKRADATGLTYAIQESSDLGVSDDWTEVTGDSYVNDAEVISYGFTPGESEKNFLRLEVTN